MNDHLQSSNLFSVKGIVAVVTGGATGTCSDFICIFPPHTRLMLMFSGIGLMMTKALALNGAEKVYIIGRRKEKLDEAAKISPNIVGIVGDVTSKESLKAIVEQVKRESGFVNLLIANSGVMVPGNPVKSGSGATLAEYAKGGFESSEDDFTNTFNVNVTAVLFTAYAFMELLDEGNKKNVIPDTKSQILITGSIAAYNKLANLSMSYRASKAAVTLMAKSLSVELVPYNIRVNSLAPGRESSILLRLFECWLIKLASSLPI